MLWGFVFGDPSEFLCISGLVLLIMVTSTLKLGLWFRLWFSQTKHSRFNLGVWSSAWSWVYNGMNVLGFLLRHLFLRSWEKPQIWYFLGIIGLPHWASFWHFSSYHPLQYHDQCLVFLSLPIGCILTTVEDTFTCILLPTLFARLFQFLKGSNISLL